MGRPYRESVLHGNVGLEVVERLIHQILCAALRVLSAT
jgi:hypothetical protein